MCRCVAASRIKATKRIADAIEACPTDQRPSAVVNASAVGFYGTSETATFDESAPAGSDYLSKAGLHKLTYKSNPVVSTRCLRGAYAVSTCRIQSTHSLKAPGFGFNP